MKIDTLKELEAVLKLCRKQGVEHIKIDNIELKLSDMVENRQEAKNATADISTQAYTEEQILNWSTPDYGA